jgi:hypothetical protein
MNFIARASGHSVRAAVYGAVALLLGIPVPSRSQATNSTEKAQTVARALPLPDWAILGDRYRPRSGMLVYRLRLRSSTAGEIQIVFERKEPRHTLSLRAETSGPLDKMFQARYQGIALAHAPPFAPVQTTLLERVGSKSKHFSTRFDREQGAVTVTRKRTQPGRSTRIDTRRFAPEVFTTDPLSGLLLVMQTDWHEGMEIEFHTLFGKDRHPTRIRCVGRARIEALEVERPVWVLAVYVQDKIVDENEEEEEEEEETVPVKTPAPAEEKDVVDPEERESARILLSDDGFREILRIQAETPMGEAQFRLREFKPFSAK